MNLAMKLTALALVVGSYTNNVYAHELRGGYVFAEEEVRRRSIDDDDVVVCMLVSYETYYRSLKCSFSSASPLVISLELHLFEKEKLHAWQLLH